MWLLNGMSVQNLRITVSRLAFGGIVRRQRQPAKMLFKGTNVFAAPQLNPLQRPLVRARCVDVSPLTPTVC